MIKGYFIDTKLQYFKDNSFNYNKFPKDIISTSGKNYQKKMCEMCENV